MGLFGHKSTQVVCGASGDYLISKWQSEIHYGDSLSVKDGETAVLLYHQKVGSQSDYIDGPYTGPIDKKNFPDMQGMEAYFINMAGLVSVKFAVPYFDVFDPRLPDLPIPTAVRGSFSFSIKDAKQFVKLHRLQSFNLEDFKTQIKNALAKYVKSVVIDLPSKYQIPIVKIETKILEVNEIVEQNMKPRLDETYGVALKAFDISVIDIDKTSAGFIKCKNLTTDFAAKKMETQQKIQLSNMERAASRPAASARSNGGAAERRGARSLNRALSI